MENWTVLVASVILMLGFAFLANLLYTDDMSGGKRVLMCGIPFSLITVLIIVLAIMKNGGTSKDPSSPMKTVVADLSVEADEEDKPSPSVVEPNDTAGAGAFASENLRRELDLELRGNPWTLARYLQAHGVLDEFGPNEGQSAEVAVNAAASLFLADDSIRERAYEKAVKLFSDAIVDAEWEEFKKAIPRSDEFDTYEEYQAYLRNLTAPTRLQPLARIAETGETISTEPADSWEAPFD